ncbi:trypsin-like peptidase domain-containing protein [Allokutzneria sp. A3M-2-11 16]|uniref:S1C family serine protease n=1 Tax=Allokutzneria sp. A3M-2-11 16 TaxID=2962043 RepID=UPI0020B7820B|nr:trypsin-like peptidase domain-containing protein [Allokutzneria sp. A3M-2-11 16]MCP3800272.1 trypsin-like peptidase domain-containing protein [Allokutzneria sp. A3M-2-11 16]
MTDNTSGASGGQPERPQQPTEGNTPQQRGVPEANIPFPGYGGQPYPQQGNGPLTNPLGVPVQGHHPQQVLTQPKPRSGRGKLVAGALVFALLGGVAGGVGGGVLGYNLALSGSSVNALDAARPDATNVNSPAPAGTVEAVAQKVLPSVVQLQTQTGSGSGVVLSSDGMILTNNHVVEEAAGGGQIRIQFKDGRTAPAKIIGVDPTSDLAVVQAEGVSGLTPVELGRSGNLRVGQQVVAIGAPFGLSNTVTSGIVSALQRPVRTGNEAGDSTVMDAVQTDAAINPGNSGGPLVDMSGKVIGINTAIKTASGGQQQSGGSIGLGFAIPIDQAMRIANELRANGKATHAVLGVTLSQQQGGSRSAVTNGATVGTVEASSAAEAAGIKQGDVITKLNDRRINDADSLIAAVRSHDPNSKVKVTVSSGGTEREVELTLGSRVLSGG